MKRNKQDEKDLQACNLLKYLRKISQKKQYISLNST